jgi:predicted nucleic acid-binding protein
VTVVLDANAVVAAPVDDSAHGRWAVKALRSGLFAAPHLLPVEATSMLRRHVAAGAVDSAVADRARADLGVMPVELFAFGPFADRVWTLRDNVTAYDAWYVALARASGPRCEFLVPGEP